MGSKNNISNPKKIDWTELIAKLKHSHAVCSLEAKFSRKDVVHEFRRKASLVHRRLFYTFMARNVLVLVFMTIAL